MFIYSHLLYKNKYIYIYTYIHTYIHTYTHTHMYGCFERDIRIYVYYENGWFIPNTILLASLLCDPMAASSCTRVTVEEPDDRPVPTRSSVLSAAPFEVTWHNWPFLGTERLKRVAVRLWYFLKKCSIGNIIRSKCTQSTHNNCLFLCCPVGACNKLGSRRWHKIDTGITVFANGMGGSSPSCAQKNTSGTGCTIWLKAEE